MMTPKDRSWAIAEDYNLTPDAARAIEMAILEALDEQAKEFVKILQIERAKT